MTVTAEREPGVATVADDRETAAPVRSAGSPPSRARSGDPVGNGARPPLDGPGLQSGPQGLIGLCRRLSAIPSHSAEIEEVADVLAGGLATTVCVMNEAGDILVSAGGGEQSTESPWNESCPPRVLRAAADSGSTLRVPGGPKGSVLVSPIHVGPEVGGYMGVDGPGPEVAVDVAIFALEHACAVCGLLLGRDRSIQGSAVRARDDLIEGILLGRAEVDTLGRWARNLGLDITLPHRVLMFAVDGDQRLAGGPAQGLPAVKHFCESRVPGALAVVRSQEVVVLCPEDPVEGPRPSELAREGLAYCRGLFPKRVVRGVLSRCCEDASATAQAYAEVSRIVDSMVRLASEGDVVVVEELGVERLLLQFHDADELRRFADDVLGALCAYDELRDTDLVATLRAFFVESENARRMARRLHVHPNTVGYRLRRIAEIAPFDLDSYPDRLAVQVALEIRDLLGPSPR